MSVSTKVKLLLTHSIHNDIYIVESQVMDYICMNVVLVQSCLQTFSWNVPDGQDVRRQMFQKRSCCCKDVWLSLLLRSTYNSRDSPDPIVRTFSWFLVWKWLKIFDHSLRLKRSIFLSLSAQPVNKSTSFNRSSAKLQKVASFDAAG